MTHKRTHTDTTGHFYDMEICDFEMKPELFQCAVWCMVWYIHTTFPIKCLSISFRLNSIIKDCSEMSVRLGSNGILCSVCWYCRYCRIGRQIVIEWKEEKNEMKWNTHSSLANKFEVCWRRTHNRNINKFHTFNFMPEQMGYINCPACSYLHHTHISRQTRIRHTMCMASFFSH